MHTEHSFGGREVVRFPFAFGDRGRYPAKLHGDPCWGGECSAMPDADTAGEMA